MIPKIAIVGAGLAGQIQAHLFRCQGIDVDIFDRAKNDPKSSTACQSQDLRTTALSASSVTALAEIGLWPELSEKACPVQAMKIGAGEDVPSGLARSFTLNAADADQEVLAHVVTNQGLQTGTSVLLNQEAEGQVRWHWESELIDIAPAETGDGAFLQLRGDDKHRHYDLIVGCDGAHSMVRRLAFDDCGVGAVYPASALVAIAHHSKPHQNRATQVFLPDGPVACLPMQGGDAQSLEPYTSSIIWSAKPRWVQAVLATEPSQRTALLSKRLEAVLGETLALDSVGSYPLRAKLSASFVRKGIALVGDAAHCVHPLAGQGFNLAMGDMMALSDCVSKARLLGQPIGHSLALESYDQHRQLAAKRIFALTDGLSWSFQGHSLPAKALRRFGFATLAQASILKGPLIHAALA